jgi:hypothetical protein
LTSKLEAKIGAEIKTNNENFEVIQCTFVSQMHTHQARPVVIQEEIIAQMDAHQERMGANMYAWRKKTTAYQEATATFKETVKAETVADQNR